MRPQATILLVDDELSTLAVLEKTLRSGGYEVEKADRARQALALLAEKPVDLAFVDYRMPEMDGLELLERLQAEYPDLPVVMLTATESIQLAVKAIKAGAFDYLNKPFNYHEILMVVEKALSARRLRQENTRLRRELQTTYQFENLVGHSAAMRAVFRRIEKAAEVDANVLIQGENGTGKELIARAIHYNSPRRRGAFVAVDCAAIPPTLLESELFGHEKGAFTGADRMRKGKFELAHKGTLFLDEVGEMDTDGQAKLLRALQERQFTRLGGQQPLEVDIRVIAATNLPLEEALAGGRFRQDLYYRLNVIPIQVPPLRNRREDIPALAEFFLRKYSMGNRPRRIHPEAMKGLIQASWPGNVRQLENVIQSALALSEGEEIRLEQLSIQPEGPGVKEPSAEQDFTSDHLPEQVKSYERSLVCQALEAAGGVEKEAARRLGISERSMWHLVKKHALKNVAGKNTGERKGTGRSSGRTGGTS